MKKISKLFKELAIADLKFFKAIKERRSINKSTNDLWNGCKIKKVSFKKIQAAVKKAVEKGLSNDIILPIVFPNALGVTKEDFKHGKKTKKP